LAIKQLPQLKKGKVAGLGVGIFVKIPEQYRCTAKEFFDTADSTFMKYTPIALLLP